MLALLALLALQVGITESDRDVSAPKKNVCVLFLLDSMLSAMIVKKMVTEWDLQKCSTRRRVCCRWELAKQEGLPKLQE